MTTPTDVLVEIVTTLTTTVSTTARTQLDGRRSSVEHHVALENLNNLLRQLPARHVDRLRVREQLASVASQTSAGALLAAADLTDAQRRTSTDPTAATDVLDLLLGCE